MAIQFKSKSSQNKKGQTIFQVHSFRCLFLQLAAEKKTPKTVHLEIFFGPSYFEAVETLQKPWYSSSFLKVLTELPFITCIMYNIT